jgi:hypothetical protein
LHQNGNEPVSVAGHSRLGRDDGRSRHFRYPPIATGSCDATKNRYVPLAAIFICILAIAAATAILPFLIAPPAGSFADGWTIRLAVFDPAALRVSSSLSGVSHKHR